jgi:hypothetical protein
MSVDGCKARVVVVDVHYRYGPVTGLQVLDLVKERSEPMET